jgi:hypothetical protein
MEGTAAMTNPIPLAGTRCRSGCPVGECFRYELGGSLCEASPADWCASEAEEAAAQLAGTLDQAADTEPPSAEARIHAHGYTALTYALLALRYETSEHSTDTGNALAELGATLRTILDAMTSPGDDLLDEIQAASPAGTPRRPVPDPAAGPTHILTWFPRWEYGTATWDIQPAPGWEHLDRPGPWPVPDLPPGRHATARQIEEWAYGKLGYRVTAVRRWRIAISDRQLRAWPQPEWALLTEVPEECDGTRAGVVATDADGRYLLRPADRPGPLQVLAPPSAHAGGRSWQEAGRGALALVGAAAPRLYEHASGWRDDRCRLVPGPTGAGHNWMILTAPGAAASLASDGQWVTRDELQQLADRTIGYAAGRIPAEDRDGRPGLAPEWVGWLAGSAIDPVGHDDLACCAQLGRHSGLQPRRPS